MSMYSKNICINWTPGISNSTYHVDNISVGTLTILVNYYPNVDPIEVL